ncbi:MAG: tRNA 5-methoxyuridine(34)/uridine 5-oxyacetic acid(34) synthase CmoB [Gammaproteobacteria bacterium]|jgi:tRNA (mo5U34)-methyltransferase|nr:tRNA 5-methoxyuridine(34)/uridine 5-oxyacetic acid(34) synthase CmoB [Gammaproteobacteria bacterium]MBT4607189.1 tRNA 5-methoxyuridine(34)/uridine 5-oxyacetic acid(34) synthase CmoB [Thiotrichales bacterium]MBT3472618.1 tRNA 5-methoxyuridine(34)/uridine 5-oxyacetic acid(34) synthase CmoB [Gammaproteobacteria bacterium]MBT3968318.1 tRNA 5-methoxyuridine(34)/uridine 5-oxyacetic acid(34) synthase CmoB [Gammaproteobacteria bacterium]MBT4080698.1 tRNA 5-methoxyuridine(34)/uridine 5-oxyacetic acid
MSDLPDSLEQSLQELEQQGFEGWSEQLRPELLALFAPGQNGNLPRWQSALQQLPKLSAQQVDLNAARLQVGASDECSTAVCQQLEATLKLLHPWRKGPFQLYGIHIDTEWRSDWKWARLEQQIQPLQGRTILDVGCGNGYYALRMAGAGASCVVGIDPNLLFLSQFQAITHFIEPQPPVHFIPVGLESLPENLQKFDTVFSMGVLYHRKSPVDHLYQLRGALRSGGELILETLIIEGGRGSVLVPEGRYAKMRNVWFIPSVDELMHWLQRVGFRQVRCLDQSVTSVEEQRSTAWMEFESLPDFLDPEDPTRTIEGHPAPRRVVLSAIAP